MSGSFGDQVFEIPQGSSVSGPSIYVRVFNQGDEPFTVRMVAEIPFGVEVEFSHREFPLQPGENRQVLIGVSVSQDAVPGVYENEAGVGVIAEAYDDSGGIKLGASAAQGAKLTVVGDTATVTVNSVGPTDQPITTTIRLFKIIDGRNYEVGWSNTGTLTRAVAPGSFIAYAYSNSTAEELAREEFDVAADEDKVVSLTVDTIYFESFAVNRFANTETGEMGWAQIVYTLNNAYQPMPNAEVKLIVTLEGTQLEEVSILTMDPLVIGRMGAPYNYTPASGWQTGTYAFSLRLLIDGELYASTNEVTLDVDMPGGFSSLLLIILGIIGGGLLLGILAFALLKRRKPGEKPEKAKKKARAKAEKKAKAKKEAPAPAAKPAHDVEILFGKEPPSIKDAEPTVEPGKVETAATPKEVVRPAASDPAPAARPVEEKPAAPEPPEVSPAGVAEEPVPPKPETASPGSTPAPTPEPRPQPPPGVRPAEARPVQPVSAPKPPERVEPAPAPPWPAAPVPPVAPAAPEPATVKPVAEREPVRPPEAPLPGRDADRVTAPGTSPEEDSLRQMPAEKAAAKPDLRVVSALEQRLSRVRKESQPDAGKPGSGETPPGATVTPEPPAPRPAAGKAAESETTAPTVEPPTTESARESQSSASGLAPEEPQYADQPAPAEETASQEEGHQTEEKDETGKRGDDDGGGTKKKFSSPIRFLNR